MININGENWRVLLVSPFHPQLQRSDGTWSIGACDDYYKTIYLSENLDTKTMKKVLCHELVHACMYSYNVDLNYEQVELVANVIATYGQEIIHMTNSIFARLKHK